MFWKNFLTHSSNNSVSEEPCHAHLGTSPSQSSGKNLINFPPELRLRHPSLHFGSSTQHLRNIQNPEVQGDPILQGSKTSRLVTEVLLNLCCIRTWNFQSSDAQATLLSDNIRIHGGRSQASRLFKSPLETPMNLPWRVQPETEAEYH